jgi:cytochrome c-type biogenesis protein CcmE
MKKVIYGILALILFLFIAYFIVLNLPQSSTKDKEASIKIEASILFDEFSTKEKKANQNYNGKIIEVTGQVRAISTDKKGDMVIILNTNDMIGGVLCTFENKPKSAIKEGQTVIIKGQCSGLLMDVVLNKCNIVN